MNDKFIIKNTIKYPTSLLIGGLTKLGLEIADSLLEQGGYVIIVDTYTEEAKARMDLFPDDALVTFLDYTSIPHLDDEIRRLDYVFYFQHESGDLYNKISTQQFLTFSNYLDATLTLATRFDARFLLTTSIKANQLIYAKEDVINNFDLTVGQKHTVYNELEIQKYSESLTIEYVEKSKLDGRILRLGEIIGDGIDFSRKTQFNQLILDAVNQKPLRLQKDGLDAEWYIHILDAAYGIIKAQFTRSTTGNIYSLTYDTPYTHLALAYKIQEADPDVKEIIFTDEKDNLPPLKLYKPATNLGAIGWTPKVSFDKAVKQSLAAAKIYLLETAKPATDNIVDKIKGFLSIADSTPSTKSEGAVGRLIAERRRQEELKKQSINYANQTIQIRKRKKVKTFREKMQDRFWGFLHSFTSTFTIFRNRGPAEIGLMIFGFILLILFYLFLLSPAIVISRNFLLLKPEVENAAKYFQNYQFTELNEFTKTARSNIEDNLKIAENFSGVSNLIGLSENYSESIRFLKSNLIMLDGLSDLSYALMPLDIYFEEYQSNLQLRNSSESFISVTNDGQDFSGVLSQFEERSPFLRKGLEKIKNGKRELGKVNKTLVPEFIVSLSNNFDSVLNRFADIESGDFVYNEFIPSILGLNSPKTYLLLLLDNTRMTPVGGEISAFSLLTVNNGSVSNIVTNSIEDINFKFDSLDAKTLQEINLTRFNLKESADINIKDYSSIADSNTYFDSIRNVFEDTFERKIDGVVNLNLTTLEIMVSSLKNQNKVLSVDGINVSDDSFLSAVSQSQTVNPNLVEKKEFLGKLFAALINEISSDYKNTVSNIVDVMGNSLEQKNITLKMYDTEYQNFLSSNNYTPELVTDQDDYIYPTILVTDPKHVFQEKYSSTTLSQVVTLNNDGSVIKSGTFSFPLLNTAQEVAICFPMNIPNSDARITNIPQQRLSYNQSDNGKCIAAQIINESEVKFEIESTLGSGGFELGIGKLSGTEFKTDLNIDIGTDFVAENTTPTVNFSGNSVIFTETLLSDSVYEITLGRK